MGGTLYDRLVEIAAREGLPRRGGVKALLGLTSGRVSQIKKEGATAKLSEESIAALTAKGYARNWVAHGKGLMRADESTPVAGAPTAFPARREVGVADAIERLAAAMRGLDEDDREIAASHLRAIARAPDSQQKRDDLAAFLTRAPAIVLGRASGE